MKVERDASYTVDERVARRQKIEALEREEKKKRARLEEVCGKIERWTAALRVRGKKRAAALVSLGVPALEEERTELEERLGVIAKELADERLRNPEPYETWQLHQRLKMGTLRGKPADLSELMYPEEIAFAGLRVLLDRALFGSGDEAAQLAEEAARVVAWLEERETSDARTLTKLAMELEQVALRAQREPRPAYAVFMRVYFDALRRAMDQMRQNDI